MELEWGGRILKAAEQLKAQKDLVLIVRHSERPSFDNIPFEQWRHVELTGKGIEVAKSFGREISSSTKTLRIHHWGSKRCFMTADAISIGARENGSTVDGPSPINFKHPILDLEAYNRELKSTHWEVFLDRWLKGSDHIPSMTAADQYAKETFCAVMSEKRSKPDGATIIATHDLYIMPLVHYAFHPKKPWIDFLDGVALKVRGDDLVVAFDGQEKKLRFTELASDSQT
ncbi:MAG: histidine phosphatase family protein [Nitrososphaerota archaeon]|jgi:broad specificity phosphatase PhoE|nr:histidine phosphatase family protein [Nitrososphaerota archaeon]